MVVSSPSSARVRPTLNPSARALENRGGRRKRDHFVTQHRRAARIGFESGSIGAQELANPQAPQLAQLLRIGAAQRAVDRPVQIIGRHHREVRQLHWRQDLACSRPGAAEQQTHQQVLQALHGRSTHSP